MTGTERLPNGWLVEWAPSHFHPETFEELSGWAYSGLKSLLSAMEPGGRVQPHILIVAPEGTGMLELPEMTVATAEDVRRLTEETLTDLVRRHKPHALVLVTTGHRQGQECILMAIDDSRSAGLIMIPLKRETSRLQLGQPEMLPDEDLLLKRIVMLPFVLAYAEGGRN